MNKNIFLLKDVKKDDIRRLEIYNNTNSNLDFLFADKKNSKCISFILFPYNEEKPYENQTNILSIIDQILSTFKFLE